MKVFKKKWHSIVLGILAILFFLTTSYFNLQTQEFQKNNGAGLDFVKWASPDETANYIFAKYYSQENDLIIKENYNLPADDIMHPRSFRSDNGEMKPVSFLGIILVYGTIGKIFSYRVIPFLTPFFASLGLIFFYLLLRRIFNKENALISVFLLAFFPPYVYYTVRSMFHNVLFTVFLIMALFFGFKMLEKIENKSKRKIILRSFFFSALAGLFLGLSVITRTSELIWLLPMFLIIWIFNFRQIGFLKLALFLVFLFISLLPVFYYNDHLYGSALSGGYSEMNSSISDLKDSGVKILQTTVNGDFKKYSGIVGEIKKTLFYFGVHPRQSWHMMQYYFVEMFAWLFWFGLGGVFLFLVRYKKVKKRHWAFLFSWLVTSFILIIYYGSWTFYDNPDPRSHTIGNSYTRYWLPVYLGTIPFFVYFMTKLSRALTGLVIGSGERAYYSFFSFHISRKFFDNSLRVLVVIVVSFWSVNFLLAGSEEGLIYLYEKNTKAKTEWQSLIDLTENNSVLITRYHDKLVFPERKVIVGDFNDRNMLLIYAKLVNELPIYYYNFTLRKKDIDYLNNRKLKEFNLQIKEIKKINYDFTLYKIIKIK
jgi:hypothetical protein